MEALRAYALCISHPPEDKNKNRNIFSTLPTHDTPTPLWFVLPYFFFFAAEVSLFFLALFSLVSLLLALFCQFLFFYHPPVLLFDLFCYFSLFRNLAPGQVFGVFFVCLSLSKGSPKRGENTKTKQKWEDPFVFLCKEHAHSTRHTKISEKKN